MHASIAFIMVGCAAASPGPLMGKGYIPSNRSVPMLDTSLLSSVNVPDSLDWTTQGKTTGIKNQGVCGCCWAFSVAEAIESAAAMAGYDLTRLSAGQICRCDTSATGCNGGDPTYGLDYVKSNGLDSFAHDPYGDQVNDKKTDTCQWDGHVAATITGYKQVPDDSDSLAAALAQYGPLAICINAKPWPNDPNEQSWSWTGIPSWADQCSDETADHCVQLVGYDKTASPPYWKVRNQWGETWGENGYVKLPFSGNNCGISQRAFVVEGAQITGSRVVV
jgi:C1A family cysteine protease